MKCWNAARRQGNLALAHRGAQVKYTQKGRDNEAQVKHCASLEWGQHGTKQHGLSRLDSIKSSRLGI